MDNEKDISLIRQEFYQNRIKYTMSSLKKGGINSYYAETKEEAKGLLLNIIPALLEYNRQHYNNSSRTIGFGDSQTLHELAVFDLLNVEWLISNNCRILNPFERMDDGRYVEFKNLENGWIEDPKPYEEAYLRVMEKMRMALLSDVFLTSANAITTNGEIVCTDGVGNRASGIIFGPYKVLIIVGRNKIVDSEEEAFSRIKNITTPMNHLRHAKKHSRRNEDGSYLVKDSLYQLSSLPCVINGHCMNCKANNCSRRISMSMRMATGGSLKDRIHVIIVNEDLGI